MKKSGIFDSWATRFGALAIVTAAQKVFEGKDAATTGIIIAVVVLSISCLHRIVSWTLLTLKEMWNSGIISFFIVGFKDLTVLMGMIFSTIAITLYSVPETADSYIGSLIIAIESMMEASRFIIILTVLPAISAVLIILAARIIFNTLRKKIAESRTLNASRKKSHSEDL